MGNQCSSPATDAVDTPRVLHGEDAWQEQLRKDEKEIARLKHEAEEAERQRVEALEEERRRRQAELARMIEETRVGACLAPKPGSPGGSLPANRYGTPDELDFPVFDREHHVPLLALINPSSGARAGFDILHIAHGQPYYKERFFDILDVVKDQHRGGLMDVFRLELNAAKDEAKRRNLRPRIISGGGDGTASFVLFIVFKALLANGDREDEGLKDAGNGFIWTDEDIENYFPALAQLPLGSANDLGNILGWGRKYPGSAGACKGCTSRERRFERLREWMAHVIAPSSQLANFDVWGLMPPKGSTACNFKLCELTGRRGFTPKTKIDGRSQLVMKEAGSPTPFFVCLYFSAGFMAYVTARFQLNRHATPLKNDCEYVRQGAGIIFEPTPPSLKKRIDGVEVDCEGQPFFPPRRDKGNCGRRYRDVGFYNINWQAHLLHGADRAPLSKRLSSRRPPVNFNDGMLDVWRMRFKSFLKNPGLRMQTDKKSDFLLSFDGARGKGLFFQWDGESRFAFSPTGESFDIYFRKVLNIPVVLGPYLNRALTGDTDNGQAVRFGFSGDTVEDRDLVRSRVFQMMQGDLEREMNAKAEEIRDSAFYTPADIVTI